MMKWILPIALVLISCGQSNRNVSESEDTARDNVMKSSKSIKDSVATDSANFISNRLIVPGERIGNIKLGTNAAYLEALLGIPDRADAAMGKAWLTWSGKRDEHNNRTELNVYTTYKDTSMRQKIVRQIRTSSSMYRTKDGLKVYSSLEEIKRYFPNLRKTGHYNPDNRDIIIYEDRENGIAFEIVMANGQQVCIGIIVSNKGADAISTYRFLHPDLQAY